MPIQSSHYTAKFRWQTDGEGVPIGEAVRLAGNLWLITCPLCSCWHEVSAAGIQTPRCLLREYSSQRRAIGQSVGWQSMYEAWCAQHPDAKAHDRVNVRVVTVEELAARDSIAVAKKRKATAPKVVPNGTTKPKTTRTRKAKETSIPVEVAA